MNYEDIRRRVGKFRLSRMMIVASPEDAMAIMGKVIVVKAETLYYNDEIEYTAMSPLFDENPDNCEPPEYNAGFRDGEFGFSK